MLPFSDCGPWTSLSPVSEPEDNKSGVHLARVAFPESFRALPGCKAGILPRVRTLLPGEDLRKGSSSAYFLHFSRHGFENPSFYPLRRTVARVCVVHKHNEQGNGGRNTFSRWGMYSGSLIFRATPRTQSPLVHITEGSSFMDVMNEAQEQGGRWTGF